MSSVLAAKYLGAPGWFKRRFELPRLQKSASNTARKLVSLKEKTRNFNTVPEPRKVPIAREYKPKPLQPIKYLPQISAESLERRLEILLGPKAVDQQKFAPIIPGTSAYQTELFVWERQLREVRKIYRAQYFRRLAQVTESEIKKERDLYLGERQQRQLRKRARLEKLTMQLKRNAMAADARQIDARVNESIEIGRRHKITQKKIQILKNFKPTDFTIAREINTTFLAGQLGAAESRPLQKSRRMTRTVNVFRETLERSYALLPEDAEEADLGPVMERGLTAEQRADLYYVGFSDTEKLELIETKLSMLQRRLRAEEIQGGTEIVTQQLIDILTAAKAAHMEKETVKNLAEDKDDGEDLE